MAKLAADICSLTRSCPHKSYPPNKPQFIDWYHILNVDENANAEDIRKRYRKLALLLHPDKNMDPQAEAAFKLVLEGYCCLTDTVKRKAFALERRKNFCVECCKGSYTCDKVADRNSCLKAHMCNLKEMRERFRQEAMVVEKCIQLNGLSPVNIMLDRNNMYDRSRRESAVFNPVNYKLDGYPHVRHHVNLRTNAMYMERKC